MESSSSDADGPPATKRARLSDCAANSANTIMAGLPNPHLEKLDSDFLYHIGYSGKDCIETFKDVKVCVSVSIGKSSAYGGAAASL